MEYDKGKNKSKNRVASGRTVYFKPSDTRTFKKIKSGSISPGVRRQNTNPQSLSRPPHQSSPHFQIQTQNVRNKDTYSRDRGRNRDDIAVNEYYLDIAFRLKAAKLFLLLLLFVFTALTALLNSKELTAENIYYLLRYIDVQSSVKTEISGFSIDIDEESQIGYYKNNIVVLKKNKIDIYDLNGRKNFSHQLAYSMPVLEISDKYILTYDSGINKLQIFNSFSKIYEYKNEYNETRPIYSASITDKGNIVYITSERGYKFAVKVINRDFKEVYECYFGDKYILAADIDNDAKRLSVAGFSVLDGDYQGEILLYDTNNDYNAENGESYRKRILINGEIPLGVGFNKSGLFAICENSFKIYDKEYENLLDYNLGYRSISSFEFTQELAAVVLNEKKLKNENNILIFDCNGKIVYSEIVHTDIIDIEFSEDSSVLYFLTRSGLYRIDTEQAIYELVTENYEETSSKIVYADNENIFISGLTKVDIIKVNQ